MNLNTYSLDGKIESTHFTGRLVSLSTVGRSNHTVYASREVKRWEEYYEVDKIDKGIMIKEVNIVSNFKTKGLVYEFAKLTNEKEINTFVQKYGLLGIDTPDKTETKDFHKLKPIFGDSAQVNLKFGYSYFEPLEVWYFYIDNIKKLLKLYRSLVNVHIGTLDEKEIEGNILNIGEAFKWDETSEEKYHIEWWDGSKTGYTIPLKEAEEGNFIGLARKILVSEVNRMANKNINNLALNIVETDRPPLGFIIQESKTTDYLINAIYFGLWELISKNEPVYICENPNCKLPYPKVKRQKYCSNACKQEAYRIRKTKSSL